MSRIESTFKELKQQGKKALIPFVTAGDPNPSLTVPLMHGLVEAGANILELGVPFSDPMADGPTIQRASERALAHRVGLKDVLSMVAEFRKTNGSTPVVLMGYANPIEVMGYEKFAKAAAESGVDGVLTVDYPPEECVEFATVLEKHGVDPIFLLSPTTLESRVEEVAKLARGFIYYVSLKGVTGAAHLDIQGVSQHIAELRKRLTLPIGVGFGIRDPQIAQQMAGVADAVVVGSRFVQEIENSTEAAVVQNLTHLAKQFRSAIDAKA